jgi:hypothetical protein
MKFGRFFVLTMAFALMLPFGAFARDKNQGNLVLDQPALVGSTQLKPGTYKVEWSGNEQSLTVNITQNRQVVATAQGQLKTNDVGKQDAVVLAPSANDSSQMAVSEIDFGGRHEALLITPNGSNSSYQSQSQ